MVVMREDDYNSKMEAIFSDEKKFKKETCKPNNLLTEKQVTRHLQTLLLHGYINGKQYKSMKPIGTEARKMRGSPKVHKPGVPLRPILNLKNSAHHKLTRWLVEILDPVRKTSTPCCLKDSFDLCQSLNSMTLPSRMVSVDVVSLFINVPLHETIDFICDFIYMHNIRLPVPVDSLKDLILLCTYNIQFTSDDTLYKQLDGVAMGSPSGPNLADAFLAKIEQQLGGELNKTTLYKRYVDDILICTPEKHFDHVLHIFPHIHPNLSVSFEKERNNQLAFLDVLMTWRPDGTIQRNVHRKKTWTGQYLHFSSFCPVSYKQDLVRTLFHRVRTISSVNQSFILRREIAIEFFVVMSIRRTL